MGLLLGELAAIVTAVCWSVTPIIFTFVGRAIGARALNLARLLLALIFLLIAHTIFFGDPIPRHVSPTAWGWLSLSGVLGLVVGDTMMYKSYLFIGPRKTILIISTSPIFSAIIAWIFLGEKLGLMQVAGILITVAGVLWVVSRQPETRRDSESQGIYLRGVLISVGAALAMAVSLVLAKTGMRQQVTVLSVTVIRMLSAAVFFWFFSAFRGQVTVAMHALIKRETSVKLLVGSLIGPFAGVLLSMTAIHFAPVGVASALMATSPVLLIPLSRRFLGDRSGTHGVAGTIIAVAGVVLLLTSG